MTRVPHTARAAEALVRESEALLARRNLPRAREWRVTKRYEGAVARLGSLSGGVA